MSQSRRASLPPDAHPEAGTVMEVLSVGPAAHDRPLILGEPVLRPVGLALVHPDRTISVWMDAVPVSGTLLLRPCPKRAVQFTPDMAASELQ